MEAAPFPTIDDLLRPHYETVQLFYGPLRCFFIDPTGTHLRACGPERRRESTTLKILTGQLSPTSGTASIDGIPVLQGGPELMRRIGVVPENLALIDDLTVEEHLLLSGPIYGLSKACAIERTAQLLRVLGLEHGRRTYLRNCSHGMRKKTALAVAIMHAPSVVILDEPFEGVDPAGAEVVRGMLLRMASRGITVLLTSHTLPMIARLAQDLVLLKNGAVVWTSEVAAIPGSLEELYFRMIDAPSPEDLTWLRRSRS